MDTPPPPPPHSARHLFSYTTLSMESIVLDFFLPKTAQYIVVLYSVHNNRTFLAYFQGVGNFLGIPRGIWYTVVVFAISWFYTGAPHREKITQTTRTQCFEFLNVALDLVVFQTAWFQKTEHEICQHGIWAIFPVEREKLQFTNNPFLTLWSEEAKFIVPDWGEKANSGTGLSTWSYQPAWLHRPAGWYDYPKPESTTVYTVLQSGTMYLATGLVSGLQMIVTACNRRLDWRVHFYRTAIKVGVFYHSSLSHHYSWTTHTKLWRERKRYKRFGLEVRNRGWDMDTFIHWFMMDSLFIIVWFWAQMSSILK